MNWALVLSLYLGDVIKGLLLVLGPFCNPVLGLRLGPAHLLFQTPSYFIKKTFKISHFFDKNASKSIKINHPHDNYSLMGILSPPPHYNYILKSIFI